MRVSVLPTRTENLTTSVIGATQTPNETALEQFNFLCINFSSIVASVTGPCSMVPMPLLKRLVERASTQHIYRFGGLVVNIVCSFFIPAQRIRGTVPPNEDDNDGNYHVMRASNRSTFPLFMQSFKIELNEGNTVYMHVLHDASGGDGVLSFAPSIEAIVCQTFCRCGEIECAQMMSWVEIVRHNVLVF